MLGLDAMDLSTATQPQPLAEPQPIRVWGERRKLPQPGPGQTPAENGF